MKNYRGFEVIEFIEIRLINEMKTNKNTNNETIPLG